MRNMRRRYGRGRIPRFLFTLIFVLAIGMGIGYAAISTTLTIDGTSDIDSASWDVHFDNVQVTTGSVSATTPAITDNTTVSFSANLENPGDYYEFTVDVVNGGTLDAKLDAITILPVLTAEQQNYFKYTVKYDDGTEIEQDDALVAGATEKLLIRFEYLTQSDTTLYPTDDQNFSFSVAMNYVQGHGNVKSIVYTTSTAKMYIGQPLSNEVTTYDNYVEAEQALGEPMYIRLVLKNDVVSASYVCADTDPLLFCVRGGGATMTGNTYNNDSIYYEDNIKTFTTLFSAENCSRNQHSYECAIPGLASGKLYDTGHVLISNDPYICEVESNGTTWCYEAAT